MILFTNDIQEGVSGLRCDADFEEQGPLGDTRCKKNGGLGRIRTRDQLFIEPGRRIICSPGIKPQGLMDGSR